MSGRALSVAGAVVALALLMVVLPASTAHAGGVVTECDEAHLLTALSGGGTVTFACSGYISLTSPITISANTTIDGSGQSVAISGSSAGRIFKVNSGVSLSLNKLRLAWGRDTSSLGGGVIYSSGGRLTITDSFLADSSTSTFGGGVMIYNGTLTVKDSTFSGNSASLGGGITSYNSTVTVSNSTFASNSTVSSQIADGSGGGIYAEGGQVTVSNSTFFRNSAMGYGGGIAGDSSTVTVTNSTFSRNTADKGGNALERSGSGAMVLRNTIVANSVAGANCAGSITDGGGNLSYPDTSCPGINRNPLLQTLNDNGGPTFTMLLGPGSPAIDAGNDATCAAAPVNNLDQRGVTRPRGAHCDIGAVEQQPYSATNVRKIPDDYPTIQSAIDAATAGDEIWVARGIYKENLSLTKGVTLSGGWDAAFTERTPGDSTISGMGSGRAISITCAISDTVVTVDGFTVEGGNATGLGGAPEMLSEAAASAGQQVTLAFDPLTPAEHVIRLRAALEGTVERGLYPGGPAAYAVMLTRVQGQVARLEQAAVQPRAAVNSLQQGADCGGGIYSWNASLRLLNSILLGNVASVSGDGCGGGVFVGQAPPGGVLIRGNTLRQNIASAASTAKGLGGGLFAIQTPGLIIADNTFQENGAMSAGLISSGGGGGLFVDASSAAVVRDNQFVRNTANGGWNAYYGLGGGAYLRLSDGASVTRNEFRENLGFVHAQGGGGGLAVVRSDQVSVVDNDVTGNWGGMFQRDLAGAEGGGMVLWQTDDIIVMNNEISSNMAAVSGALSGTSFGGGLEAEKWYGGRIQRNVFDGNVASQTGIGRGGGASLWGTSDAWVTDNAFTGNAAALAERSGAGGGLFLLNTQTLHLAENSFQDNLASASGEGHGGGLCVWSEPYNSDLTADANLFLGNRATADAGGSFPSDGGACYFDSYGLTFTDNVVAGNSADQGGGLYLPFAEDGVVTNNTLVGNNDAAILVDVYNRTAITFTNNIVVSHTVGISVTQGATVTVSYTLWHDNDTDIGGNGLVTQTHPVTGDPAFVDPAADDYRLTVASAARDAGDPAGVPPAPKHDANGVPRPQGPRVDIGAYEWRGYWQRLPLVYKQAKPIVGWAVGDSSNGYGTILRTTDGGATWVRQGTPGEVPDVSFGGVSAVDEANAWVVGERAILRTRDGGLTWETQPLPAGAPVDTALFGVKAIDGNTAWAVGKPDVLLGTTDGRAWRVLSRGADLQLPWPVLYSDVDAADATHVWAVGAAGETGRDAPVIAFYDGVQWHRQGANTIISGNGAALIGVSALDQATAWAVGGVGFAPFPMARTMNGGASWQQTGEPPIPGMDTNRVVAITSDVGWASGDDGNVVYTTDAGLTWTHTPLPSAYLFGVTAIDDKNAWVVGLGANTQPPGVIARTRDALHWEVQSDSSWPNLYGISFAGARR